MDAEPTTSIKIALINLDQAFALLFAAMSRDGEFEEKPELMKAIRDSHYILSKSFGKIDFKYDVYKELNEKIENYYETVKNDLRLV